MISRAIAGATAGAYLDSPAMSEWQEMAAGAAIGMSAKTWAQPWLVHSIEKTGQGIATVSYHTIRGASHVGKRAAGRRAALWAAGKGLSRVAFRAVPYVGWGLLAYDVYTYVKD